MKIRETLSLILLLLAITAVGCVLGANIYNSIVDVPNWNSNLPRSITIARGYFNTADPGTFFRFFSPFAMIVILLTLFMTWNRPPFRKKWLSVSLLCLIVADVLTFSYFYPRNEILFLHPVSAESLTALQNALNEWKIMNYVRSLIVFVGFLALLQTFRSRIE